MTPTQTSVPPTRIRRPSIRSSTRSRPVTLPTSVSEPTALVSNAPPPSQAAQPKPLPHPHLRPSTSSSNLASLARLTTLPISRNHAPPEYDIADEENLPSPFLRRSDKIATIKSGPMETAAPCKSAAKTKRSSGFLLRAVAAANNAGRRSQSDNVDPVDRARPSLASARKASEEARKALSRP
jgi:NIMA (never in mitosis gene a)-related kinase